MEMTKLCNICDVESSMMQIKPKKDRSSILCISRIDSFIRCLIILVTSMGALFTNSSLFVDSQILPKWFVAIGGVLMYFIYSNLFFLFSPNKKVNRKSLIPFVVNVVIALVSIQALYGILQYFNILSPTTKFQVTGSYDNPAGFAASLVIAFPFFLLAIMKSLCFLRWGIIVLSVIVAIAVFLSGSRAGILSMVVILICWGLHYWRFSVKMKWVLVLVVLISFLGGLYQINKDSANGRLLIWRCSLEMIKDNWLIGYGRGGFETHYMDYQANYFKRYPDSSYAQLADDVQCPFNEYLDVLINYGLIGLLLILIFLSFLVCCYYRKPTQDKRIAILSLISMSTFSFFSYPTLYPFVWLIILLNISILLKEYIKLNRRYLIHILVLFLCTICSYQLFQRVKAELKWKQIVYKADEYSTSIYEELEKVLGEDRYFMYNYAVMLFNCDQIDLCLQKALICRKLWVNYDLELLLGNIYREKGKYEIAEEYYVNASRMCPCRFFPLYQLFELYKEIKCEEKAFSIADIILKKPIKVNSILVKRIKFKMKKEIDTFVN